MHLLTSWFQSTHPHGVRHVRIEHLAQLQTFQSTHPHGVRLLASASPLHASTFQSTHPLGVRQLLCDVSFTHSVVSIHAPTRGATMLLRNASPSNLFQSTHPLGGRLSWRFFCSDFHFRFNPRTHSGCDGALGSLLLVAGSFNSRTHSGCDYAISVRDHGIVVSIHAPTRGATDAANQDYQQDVFQSTHPLGVRLL